jgi:hypothetical protein
VSPSSSATCPGMREHATSTRCPAWKRSSIRIGTACGPAPRARWPRRMRRWSPPTARMAPRPPTCVFAGPGARVFYDLDTPVTLAALAGGERPDYLPLQGLGDFDLVLSFTGGAALDRLRIELGARRVLPLYGSVDPDAHRPVSPIAEYRADLSYLGTYAADRQPALQALLIDPARHMPERRFFIGGRSTRPNSPGRRTSTSSATCRRSCIPPSSPPPVSR